MQTNQLDQRVSSHILPTSATMVGVCVTVIGIVRLVESHAAMAMIVDDIVAVASLLFLVAALLSYLSLRSPSGNGRLESYADVVFMVGLGVMVLTSFMLAWDLGQVPLSQRGAGGLGTPPSLDSPA